MKILISILLVVSLNFLLAKLKQFRLLPAVYEEVHLSIFQ